jgi:multidrug transporter EmrE-like cation transporter
MTYPNDRIMTGSIPARGGRASHKTAHQTPQPGLRAVHAVAFPIGIWGAAPAFTDPVALAAAVGVGVGSSVVPYVCDQLAMARLTRATYALMVSLFPAIATVIGVVVLTQVPTPIEIIGVVLVIAGVAIHKGRSSAAVPAVRADRGHTGVGRRRQGSRSGSGPGAGVVWGRTGCAPERGPHAHRVGCPKARLTKTESPHPKEFESVLPRRVSGGAAARAGSAETRETTWSMHGWARRG